MELFFHKVDFLKADYHNPRTCPIARLLQRLNPRAKNIVVGGETATMYFPGEVYPRKYLLREVKLNGSRLTQSGRFSSFAQSSIVKSIVNHTYKSCTIEIHEL